MALVEFSINPLSREWVGGRSCLIILRLVKERSHAHSTIVIVIEVVGSIDEAEEDVDAAHDNVKP
jgi:hypothetical protein